MTTEFLLLSIATSLLSGLLGVFVSFGFFHRLETRKLKTETARKLFGSRHNIQGSQFKEAMNEVMIVFSDSQKVIDAMENLWRVVDMPDSARSESASNDALIGLMKSICAELGIKYKKLNDSYYLRFFSTRS